MNQIIIKGDNSIKRLEQFLGDSKVSKVLLVHDSAFNFLPIKDQLLEMNVECVTFSDFKPNPLYEEVCKGVEIFNREKCQAIIAVGGGSAIDVAKCIKLYSRMDNTVNYLQQECSDSGYLLVAIPTTAGTGSESTRFAVIYYDGKKQSVAHESIIPNCAVLEPSVLKTLPLYQKKCTMLDALCQGIESYWSINSTDESKEYSKKAIELIMEFKDEYLNDNTLESAEKIMIAANYSGKAINITQTTAAHAMSYKITSLYNLPHGHAVALCLPNVWRFMLNNTDRCSDKRGSKYLSDTLEQIAHLLKANSQNEAIENFEKMLNSLQMPKPQISDLKVEIAELKSSVNPVRLKNNPVIPNENEVEFMYNNILTAI